MWRRGAPHGDQSRTPPGARATDQRAGKGDAPDPASLTRGQCRSREGIALAALPQVLIFCALPLSMGGACSSGLAVGAVFKLPKPEVGHPQLLLVLLATLCLSRKQDKPLTLSSA
ncbi:hypothetical protein AGOR_G00068960 [Albula goreensis]|uniref:Uncharacterized protein n=1 Tax=Albula goreensis TaxID=1534307 RepID=A0A8T3DPG8_9TELE|nr:hypothetical protein AGOR_G00068960 [Albula goreensis]